MLRALGCQTVEIDGNSVEEISAALANRKQDGRPFVMVGRTVKGKGVSFMEGENKCHHATMSEEEYQRAMTELNA